MTDNDIIKALEWHLNRETHCNKCPYKEFKNRNDENCVGRMLAGALDLINQKDAEIERLNGRVEATEISKQKLLSCFETAKSEAIKEFAKKVETELDERVSENIRNRNPHWYIAKRIVRETAIEMTEVK